VSPGDEVIVPSFTFVATAAAVIYCGATPVFADIVGEHDLSIDPDHVRELLSPRTRAVTAVHFAGYPAPVDRLAQLCEEHGVALIEDAAHAPSATLAGRKLGTFGRSGAFSFFSNKILSIGEGGLLATDDEQVARQARHLRSHAMSSGTWERHTGATTTYDVTGLGFNYRTDEPHSALALSRLSGLEDDIARRRELTRAYRQALADIDGVSVPFTDESVEQSSCYVMPVVLADAERRREVRDGMMSRHGVQTSIYYPPVHRFSAYVERYGQQSLPRTESEAAREVTLPPFAHLAPEQQRRVIDALTQELAP
jgi:dTDP-4-amino-4,6-dideoxygalactose transaminase